MKKCESDELPYNFLVGLRITVEICPGMEPSRKTLAEVPFLRTLERFQLFVCFSDGDVQIFNMPLSLSQGCERFCYFNIIVLTIKETCDIISLKLLFS